MLTKRIISTLLAVMMLLGAFTVMVGAEDAESAPVYTKNTSTNKPSYWYFTGKPVKEERDDNDNVSYVEDTTKDSLINTPQDKLALMDLRYQKGDYRLYVDEYSGEVAVECISTGEILFTNPYTIDDSKAKDTVKKDLMSQLIVTFTDVTSGQETTYDSYTWCASRGQNVVKPIKNGIRVEYSIGREEAKMLVPQLIKKESLDAIVTTVGTAYKEAGGEMWEEFWQTKIFWGFYKLYDGSTNTNDTVIKKNVDKGVYVYQLDTTITAKEKAKIEQWIKTYCPTYTYEQLDQDHMEVDYVPKDENAPLFKMALEYTLDEYGMSVRLPANGIRFNETLYRLENVSILPYMGAGRSPNEGYTFFPDGSGALFDFDELYESGTFTNIAGKVYGGNDFAYHEITGTHQEIIRYPVFGLVEDETITDVIVKEPVDATAGTEPETETVSYNKMRGYFAIVEEGDALMELATYHRMDTCEYHTVTMKVYPRPKDSYNVSDSISVGSNSTWTVVSSRKYTGSYKIRYIMLTDPEVAKNATDALTAEGKTAPTYYDTTYVGMAMAYREYLERQGILTRKTAENTSGDIPLFIETFGAMETVERFLSVPINVMTPLTTFEDITLMYGSLKDKGISNVNFVMTGYTDGGMTYPSVAYRLDWENAVDDEMKFEELVEHAKNNGYKVFPDFDFVFASTNTLFDGLTLKKHAVKTIDGRYTSKREYSSTKQTYLSYFELALSPAYLSHFYEKLIGDYSKYDVNTISVSTLGSYLNSDFDEDEPYNRADAEAFSAKAFEYISGKYEYVLSEGGNSYCWQYVDYLTDVALDSSRYYDAAASVPFLGMVLHGYVEFAGTPINMEGNIEYALLKAIESGASLKFILSYRNTENLKEDVILNQYYSINYDIWQAQLVELYTELNSLLKGVQTSTIVHHEFINNGATRVPTNEEIAEDIEAAIADAIARDNALKEAADAARKNALKEARKSILGIDTALDGQVSGTIIDGNPTTSWYMNQLRDNVASLQTELDALEAAIASNDEAKITEARAAVSAKIETIYGAYATETAKLLKLHLTNYEAAKEGYELIVSENAYTANIREILKNKLDAATTSAEVLKIYNTELDTLVKKVYDDVKAVDPEFEIEPFVRPGAEPDNNGATDGTVTDGTATDGTATDGTATDGTQNAPVVEDEEVYSKYNSDENKIVYEVYENGTAFLLNFNNYTVSVTLPANGVTYTIEAYGYVVISRGN